MDARLKALIHLIATCCVMYTAAKYFPMGIHEISKKGYYTPVVGDYFDRSEVLLDYKGRPTKKLLKLLQMFNIEHDGTLEGIVDSVRNAWFDCDDEKLRQSALLDKRKMAEVFLLLKKLTCVDEILPSQKYYKYGVVIGYAIDNIRSRLAYLFKQWNNGVRFKTLVFLSGNRLLDPILETKEVLLNSNNDELPFSDKWVLKKELPTTELEMIKMVFDQAELPRDFQKVNVVFINAELQKQSDDFIYNMTAEDRFKKWMQINPQEGTCLIVSEQPYVGFHDSVARTILSDGFEIEVVANAADQNISLAVYLDSLAHWLQQEQERSLN